MKPIRSLIYFAILSAFCYCQMVDAQISDRAGQQIRANNAQHVKPVREFSKRADRLERGPEKGQWIVKTREPTPSGKRPRNQAELLGGMALQPLHSIAPKYKPEFVVFAPGGKRIAFKQPGAKNYLISDVDGNNETLIELDLQSSGADFSPDGKLIAIGCMSWDPKVEGAGYSVVRLFDADGKHVRDFESNGAGGIRPLFSPDGKTLAAGNRNHGTQLFDVETGKMLHKLKKTMTQEHAFSPDGQWLAEGYVDGTVAIWDVASGKLLHSAPSGCREIYSVDWSPSGKVLASSGRDGNIILWDTSNMKKLKELDAPFWVIRVRFSRDGTQLLTASASNHSANQDRKITFWAVSEE